MDRGYELRYLPVFYDDLYKIVSYIREKLLEIGMLQMIY